MTRIAVVGAGICGLATAELLQRYDGNAVVLIEVSNQFGTGSTMDQHGWFHAGNLYSLKANMPSVSAAIRNLGVVAENYAALLGAEQPWRPNGTVGNWFVNQQLHYIFPNETFQGFGEGESTAVCEALSNFASNSPSIAAAEALIGSLRNAHRGPAGLRVVGADAPMNTHQILLDLAGSFLAHGGSVRFCTLFASHRCLLDGSIEIKLDDGGLLEVDKLVITSGAGLVSPPTMLPAASIRKSPVMVCVPELCPDNFVLVEDTATPSLSHIVHRCNGQPYSVFSGGYSASLDDAEAQERAANALRAAVSAYFPRIARSTHQIFFGTKVDVPTAAGTRDYAPNIFEIDRGVIAAFPGKFSFSFLLADSLAKRIMVGERAPAMRCMPVQVDSELVARPRHESIARSMLARRPSSVQRILAAVPNTLQAATQQAA